MSEHNSVQSVERTFALIELLCKHGKMTVTALSAASGLHKTTVFRLLNTLSTLGYVEKDPQNDRYALTLHFLKISSKLLAGFDLRAHARPFFERLSKECGETVHLVKRDHNDIVYIDKFESSDSSVRMVSQIGLSLPMTCTAVGKAILAQLEESEVRQIWNAQNPVSKTPHTITDIECFLQELKKVRACGYAVDNEENELGVRCVAAVLPDTDDQYRYAFSVSAPISRMDDTKLEEISGLVLKTQAAILH